MTTKIPKSVKVAHYDIKIVPMSDFYGQSKGRWGEFCAHSLTIQYDDKANDGHVKDTILHEILHAIYWAYNIDDDDKEERIVTIFATALVTLFQNNPAVAKYLLC